jgi:hypothetical protein
MKKTPPPSTPSSPLSALDGSAGRIKLVIQGLGEIPSFKNSKLLTRGRIITDPKKQQKMEALTRVIASLLASAAPIPDGGTLTEQHLQSWIASSLPLDDSRQWIPELLISSRDVDRGNEGVDILIEKL